MWFRMMITEKPDVCSWLPEQQHVAFLFLALFLWQDPVNLALVSHKPHPGTQKLRTKPTQTVTSWSLRVWRTHRPLIAPWSSLTLTPSGFSPAGLRQEAGFSDVVHLGPGPRAGLPTAAAVLAPHHARPQVTSLPLYSPPIQPRVRNIDRPLSLPTPADSWSGVMRSLARPACVPSAMPLRSGGRSAPSAGRPRSTRARPRASSTRPTKTSHRSGHRSTTRRERSVGRPRCLSPDPRPSPTCRGELDLPSDDY